MIAEWDLDNTPTVTNAEAMEIENALAVYARYPERTPPEMLERMMAKLSLAYPALRISPTEAKAKIELYHENLRDIPPDILGLAFAAAVKTCKFFPSVAELRDLAKQQPNMRLSKTWFLKRLLEKHRRGA